MLWDLFCRVIDNWGDIGLCWRLASDLRSRGHHVRLWVDDPSALSWMAPQAPDALNTPTALNAIDNAPWNAHTLWPEPGDVVIEAFGCDPPAAFVARMAAKAQPPCWINLEYLSAEAAALQNHGLRSPQPNGLDKYFFYPGWLEHSGGLLRETDLESRQAQFDAQAWWASQKLTPHAGEQRVSLFCYHNPALPSLLQALQRQATWLLVAAGHPTQQVQSVLGSVTQINGLRVSYLPPLKQTDFDHLLWACDMNWVRGEDSFVRAQWAKRPFIWHIYPQSDGAHRAKLLAFHQLWTEHAGLGSHHHALSLAWNGLSAPQQPLPWPPGPQAWQQWQAQTQMWCAWLRSQTDLSSRLLDFVSSHTAAVQR